MFTLIDACTVESLMGVGVAICAESSSCAARLNVCVYLRLLSTWPKEDALTNGYPCIPWFVRSISTFGRTSSILVGVTAGSGACTITAGSGVGSCAVSVVFES